MEDICFLRVFGIVKFDFWPQNSKIKNYNIANQISRNNLIIVTFGFREFSGIAEFECDLKISKFRKIVIFNKWRTCYTEFIIRVWKSVINCLIHDNNNKLQVKR